jgi:hypothetical protein
MTLPSFDAWMPKKLIARLAVVGQIFGGDIERPRCPGFLDRYIDTSKPGIIHPHVGDEISAGVGDGDVHRLADLICLLFRSRNYSSRIFKFQHEYKSSVRIVISESSMSHLQAVWTEELCFALQRRSRKNGAVPHGRRSLR